MQDIRFLSSFAGIALALPFFVVQTASAEYVNSMSDTDGRTWKMAAPIGWSTVQSDYPGSVILTGCTYSDASTMTDLAIPGVLYWDTHGSAAGGNVPVTTIRWSAFQDNDDIVRVYMVANRVSNIGTPCFLGCSNLEEIHYGTGLLPNFSDSPANSANGAYCTVDGVLYTKDMTKLVKYPEGKSGRTFVVPKTVTELAPYCLANTKLACVMF